MTLKTCLLITDDMDDHQIMSEALEVISENTVLLNIINSQKAVQLLRDKGYRPDYLILDLSMHGIKVNSILKVVYDELKDGSIRTVGYGYAENLQQIDNAERLVFFNKDYGYSELIDFLRKIFC